MCRRVKRFRTRGWDGAEDDGWPAGKAVSLCNKPVEQHAAGVEGQEPSSTFPAQLMFESEQLVADFNLAGMRPSNGRLNALLLS